MRAGQALGEREIGLATEAAEWRLLSLLFSCPGPAWAGDVKDLMADVRDEEIRCAAGEALAEASEGRYHHAFGPGGPAPPREASYHRSLELGYLISELEICYHAFAFARRSEEPPDHVAVEADFIAYLRFKEAYAVACEDVAQASACADAARTFVATHLSQIAQPLAGLLADSGIGYLSKAGAALLRRVGPPASPRGNIPVQRLPGPERRTNQQR